MKYYSSKTVTKILGVTAQTLRNWDKEGKLKPYNNITIINFIEFYKFLKTVN